MASASGGGAASVVDTCREGYAVVHSLRDWRASLGGDQAKMLKQMTVRVIKMPLGCPDREVEQTLPDSYTELMVSTLQNNLQHQISVFLMARELITVVNDHTVSAAHRDTTRVFVNRIYGDRARRALPSAKCFRIPPAHFSANLRHLLHLPIQVPGLESFGTFSNLMKNGATTSHFSRRHNAARAAICASAKDCGAPYATPEPGNIVRAIDDHSFVLELDGGIQLPSSRKITFDVSVHNFRNDLAKCEARKKNGHGTVTARRQALAVLTAAKAELRKMEADSPAADAQRAVVEAARRRLGKVYHPGYAASCGAAGYGFHAMAIDEFGNFGEGALGLLDELQHPSDRELRGQDLSAAGNGVGHWFHERMTFITGRSREWIVQRVAVAVANATYDAALQLASASRGPDATAFQAVHLTPTHSTCTYAGSPDSTPTPTP